MHDLLVLLSAAAGCAAFGLLVRNLGGCGADPAGCDAAPHGCGGCPPLPENDHATR